MIMKKQLIISLRLSGIMVVLLGIVYPLFITGMAQVCCNAKANGSLVEINGVVRGSRLIGQQSDQAAYFHARPSAADYNTLPSGASNLGLTSKKLYEIVEVRRAEFLETNKLASDSLLPAEMIFASASGLDPHISPLGAILQIDRIAQSRSYSSIQKTELIALVNKMTEGPQFGLFGCSRVNVFMLNLELDKIK